MTTPAERGAGLGVVASVSELIGLRAHVRAGTASRSVTAAAAPGNHLSPRKSRGMEFSEARPYQSGDDVRALDWRQTARRGRPYTKLFQEEHERPVHLLVDMGSSMRFGTRVAFKSVLAARSAALLAWQAVAVGDRVGALVCQGDDMRVIRPQSRQHGVLTLLACLAAVSAAPPAAPGLDWITPLQTLARTVRPGSQIVILSDFATLDADATRQLAALARSADLVLLHIYDMFEAEAPPPGLYRVTDGQHSLNLDLRSVAARSAYGAAFAERRLALQTLARHSGATWLPLTTHMAPETVVLCAPAFLPGGRVPRSRLAA